MKKFEVVSLHPFKECDLDCPFCYRREQGNGGQKPREFFLQLIPEISKITNQIACGGGEPFLDKEFVKDLGEECKKNGLIFNITTNVKILSKTSDNELVDLLRNVTMLSISFDKFKIKNRQHLLDYFNLVGRIKKLTKTQVGCNLLLNPELVEFDGLLLIRLVDGLFAGGVDRVFALYPKNAYFVDILKCRGAFYHLTEKHGHFYMDDCSKMILEENRYSGWSKPCHYGKMISIDEAGRVKGCSFEKDGNSVLMLKKPSDLRKVSGFGRRFDCPFIKK